MRPSCTRRAPVHAGTHPRQRAARPAHAPGGDRRPAAPPSAPAAGLRLCAALPARLDVCRQDGPRAGSSPATMRAACAERSQSPSESIHLPALVEPARLARVMPGSCESCEALRRAGASGRKERHMAPSFGRNRARRWAPLLALAFVRRLRSRRGTPAGGASKPAGGSTAAGSGTSAQPAAGTVAVGRQRRHAGHRHDRRQPARDGPVPHRGRRGLPLRRLPAFRRPHALGPDPRRPPAAAGARPGRVLVGERRRPHPVDLPASQGRALPRRHAVQRRRGDLRPRPRNEEGRPLLQRAPGRPAARRTSRRSATTRSSTTTACASTPRRPTRSCSTR